MRILHVIASTSAARGGPTSALRSMTQGLAGAGVQVDVATTDDDGIAVVDVPRGQPIADGKVRYWYFARQTRFYLFSWPLTRWLESQVRTYDLLHIHGLFTYAAIPSSLLAYLAGVPFIVRPFGTLDRWGMERNRPRLKRLSLRLLESRILNRCAVIHYTSEHERQQAAEQGIVHRNVIIPHAIAPHPVGREALRGALRRKVPWLAHRKIVLFLSRLVAIKGLDLLLRAFAAVRERHPEAALVIAGDGTSLFVEQLLREAQSLNVAADIVWTGFVGGMEKWELLADADVFVLPSYSESFGIAAAEAMSYGVPVVVSDQVGIHRDIIEAGAGLGTPCRYEPLAAAICRILADPQAGEAMGQCGKQLAMTKFSPEAITAKLMATYRGITQAV